MESYTFYVDDERDTSQSIRWDDLSKEKLYKMDIQRSKKYFASNKKSYNPSPVSSTASNALSSAKYSVYYNDDYLLNIEEEEEYHESDIDDHNVDDSNDEEDDAATEEEYNAELMNTNVYAYT